MSRSHPITCFRLSIAMLGLLALVAGSAAQGATDKKTFISDLKTLTAEPHRRAGYQDGSLRASEYVEKRLRQIGFSDDDIHVLTFPVIQPITTECELIAGEQSYQIFPAMPNLIQASVTPEEGLTYETMYVGNGEVSEYGNRLAKDKIVVMDFDSGKNWQTAFAFGARAVLFIGSDKPAANALHYVNVPANLPRFYVPADVASKLQLATRPRSITLKAACEWKELRGRNVVAIVRGTNPAFDPKRPAQAVVLAAPLDSISEIPDLGPSARYAANCAGLLRLAKHFRKSPPRRDVILAFLDAQSVTHMGARAVYGALYRRKGARKLAEVTLAQRLERLEAEQEYQKDIATVLDALTPLTNQYWRPWGVLYARKADLKHTEDRLVQKLEDIKASKANVETLDYPVDDIIARLDAKIAATSESIETASENLAEQQPALDAEMAALEEQMDTPELNAIKLFSSDGQPSNIEDMGRHSEAVRFLRDETTNFDSDVLEKLAPLRIRRREQLSGLKRLTDEGTKLRKQLKDLLSNNDTDAEAIAQLRESVRKNFEDASVLEDSLDSTKQEIAIWARRDMGWNSLKGVLFKGILTKETRGRLARIVHKARKVIDRRLGELDQLITETHQATALYDAIGPNRNEIVLHISMNLGDARDRWTFIHGDDSVFSNYDKPGNYSPIWKVARNLLKRHPGRWTNFDRNAVSDLYPNRMFAPGLFADSGGIAGIFAIQNISAVTSMDRFGREGQPSDSFEALDTDAFYSQLSSLTDYLGVFTNDEGLNLQPQISPRAIWAESKWTGSKSTGASVLQAGAGSAIPDRPVRDGIAAIYRVHRHRRWKSGQLDRVAPGFVFPILAKTNTTGIYEIGPYSKIVYRSCLAIIATFDKTTTGNDEIAKEYKTRGIIDSISTQNKYRTKRDTPLWRWSVNLFKTRAKTMVGYGYDRGALASVPMRALSTAKFRKDRHLLCEVENVTTLFAPASAKGFKLFNKAGLALLNNSPTKAQYKGIGISLEDQFEHPVIPEISAHDLGALNRFRLKTLRKAGIIEDDLEILSGEAHDTEKDADAMLITDGDNAAQTVNTSIDKHYGDKAASAALSRRVYTPLIAQMKDLVTAVVLLLLLAMPFAYALERLLIGSPHIYRQIGWFAFFFLLTFTVLYFVNPAFRIAATPAIIFLAFTIILLSSLVIFIMVRKLQTEIKKMQGLSSSVHSADVSRLSTMMAAVNMGISTMRRRPVRTLLTAVTVLLLTFTILTFASFGSKWDVGSTYQGPMMSSPTRILIRQQLWGPIGQELFQMVRGHLEDQADVVARYWVAPTAQDVREMRTRDMIVASGDAKRISPVSAVIGLDLRDIQRQGDIAKLFSDSDQPDSGTRLADYSLLSDDGIILTQAVADELKLTGQDIGKATVLLAGREFTYAGVVSDRLAGASMLDGSSMLPVDYHSSAGASMDTIANESTSETASEMPDVESAQFVYYNIDQIVIIPPKIAAIMGGQIRSVTIYPNDVQKVMEISRRAAMISELPSYAGHREGVYRMFFKAIASASGVKELIIPVVLGGLIVFATMLGSVSDREREIYTFSSLGLAPAHVASLFFAEASIYAVIGGMGGYLLGQIVARGMGYLGQMGLVSVPSMNYSSTNAIVTVLIVMFTVLISTVYPAMKASRSANPGIQRSWTIPKPEGNLYDLIFPFTVSAYDIIGVVSFLQEHFNNYSDTSLGVFASMDSHIFKQTDNDMLGFRATVALAPFDLGVTQEFALLSQPSDIEGIDQIRIMIYRHSGAHGDWQRSNRMFVNELRKQLLIWRSLSQEVMDKYRETTLANWDTFPVEQVDRQSIGGQA